MYEDKKVLVVDDSKTDRHIIKDHLEQIGFKSIMEVPDGQEALAKFFTSKFDFIISDWEMPNMNGLELLVEIRKKDSKIPFLMITALAQPNRVKEAIQHGVTGYIIKPFTYHVFAKKVEDLLSNT